MILTGSNPDGAQGLATIQAQGGECLVQDPATAAFGAMPEAAAKAAPKSEIRSLEGLRLWIVGLAKKERGNA
jgi:chemotaxis response regulator CheB